MKFYDFWPTLGQQRLLAAALTPGPEGLAQWTAWRADLGDQAPDEGSFRLWPLVYDNLRKTASAATLPPEAKAKYVKTHFQNRNHIRDLEAVVAILADAGIPCLLLKGAALILGFYRDLGLRPMSDLDIAVPHAQIERATQVLLAAGWSHRWEGYRARPLDAHASTLISARGSQLDLHFSPIHNIFLWDQIEPFWRASTTIGFDGRSFQTLCAADHLFQTIAHGAQFNPVAPIRWVADAAWILRGEAGVDWDLFVARARGLRFSYVMARALDHLDGRYGLELPAPVRRRLHADASGRSRLDYWRRRIGPDIDRRRVYAKAFNFWTNYALRFPDRSAAQLVLAFPAFLRSLWSAESLGTMFQSGLERFRRL